LKYVESEELTMTRRSNCMNPDATSLNGRMDGE